RNDAHTLQRSCTAHRFGDADTFIIRSGTKQPPVAGYRSAGVHWLKDPVSEGTMNKRVLVATVILIAVVAPGLVQAQTPITLASATAPAAGQPGVTALNLTGSGFPAGT